MRRLGLLIIPAVWFSGCTAAMQDCYYEHSQKKRAWHAWSEYAACTPNCIDDADYRAGWKAGYYDVLMGNPGTPPLVPPKKYWAPSEKLHNCNNNRHQWYVGFQDGVNCAKRQPDTHFIELWMPPADCPVDSYCPTPEYTDAYLPPMVPMSEDFAPTPAATVESPADTPALEPVPEPEMSEPAPAPVPNSSPVPVEPAPKKGPYSPPAAGEQPAGDAGAAPAPEAAAGATFDLGTLEQFVPPSVTEEVQPVSQLQINSSPVNRQPEEFVFAPEVQPVPVERPDDQQSNLLKGRWDTYQSWAEGSGEAEAADDNSAWQLRWNGDRQTRQTPEQETLIRQTGTWN